MVSIIIINWNGLEDTIECVDSILQNTATAYQLYIIDNNSSKQECVFLDKKYGKYDHINLRCNNENLGFVGAHLKVWHNDLISSDSEYIVLINNDTTVEKSWLKPLISTAKTQRAQVVSCKMINYYNRAIMDNAGHQIISTGEVVPIAHNLPVKNFYNSFVNAGACGGACLYDKKMLEEMGFFDPHFSTGYEDAELGIRALALGKKAVFCPESIIYHKGGQSIKKIFNTNYAIQNQRNILYVFFKLFPTFQIVLYYPIILLKTLIIILFSFFFFKWNYINILIQTHVQFLRNDLVKALKARRAFFSKNHNDNSFQFYLNQKSFVTFELGRLYSYLILRKPSALDKYR